MDCGIIKNIKHYYRTELVLKYISSIDKNNSKLDINLVESINMLSKVWNTNVKSETIRNCFKKPGFMIDMELTNSHYDSEASSNQNFDKILWNAYNGFATLNVNNNEFNISEYINIEL